MLALRRMADFKVVDAARGGAPTGLTEDGIVYYEPRSEADAQRLGEILRTALSEAPSRYWQLVYGAIYEDPAECEHDSTISASRTALRRSACTGGWSLTRRRWWKRDPQPSGEISSPPHSCRSASPARSSAARWPSSRPTARRTYSATSSRSGTRSPWRTACPWRTPNPSRRRSARRRAESTAASRR